MLLKKMHTINPVKGPTPGSRARVEEQGAHGTDPEVQTIREGKHATVGGRLLFDRGSAELTPETRKGIGSDRREDQGPLQHCDGQGSRRRGRSGGQLHATAIDGAFTFIVPRRRRTISRQRVSIPRCFASRVARLSKPVNEPGLYARSSGRESASGDRGQCHPGRRAAGESGRHGFEQGFKPSESDRRV